MVGKTLTLADITMLVQAAKIAQHLGAWSINADREVPEVFVGAGSLRSLMTALGVPVTIQRTHIGTYEARTTYDGVSFTAVIAPEELPQFGYCAPPPDPVPLPQ